MMKQRITSAMLAALLFLTACGAEPSTGDLTGTTSGGTEDSVPNET